MRWTREDCWLVRFATRTVACGTLARIAPARSHSSREKIEMLRRVWSSPHFPSRSAPAAAGEPVAELAVAAVDLVVVEQAEPEGLEVRVVAGGRAEPAAP